MAELSIVNLSAGYGAKPTISGINVVVRGGELTAIVGPNGAGKSTLLRAIAGDLSPMSGNVFLNGADIHKLTSRQRAAAVAFVEQSIPPLDITVQQYVTLGRTPHRSLFSMRDSRHDADCTQQAMCSVGIQHLAHAPLSRISGGERQMAAIAKALAQQPQVMLLDEPTSNLDIANQKRILQTIVSIARSRGIIAIAVLHDLNQAAAYSHSAMLMNGGGVAASGVTAQTITQRNIEEVYKTTVTAIVNPQNGATIILP